MNLDKTLESIVYPLIGKWRNNFHLELPFGLMNDPCGLSYIDGVYNIFFQWNPNGCDHKTKHWGLVQTKNFINYSKPILVLKPDSHIDKDGCYTGSATVINNQLYLFYTGNVRDKNNIRIPHQNISFIKDNTVLKKKNIIYDSPCGYTDHYRDPYYFQKNGIHYLAIGAQNSRLNGRVVIYESKDLESWTFKGELNTQYTKFGKMWECPNIFNLNDKDILAICPQGLKSEKYKYQNLHQSGYIVGKMDIDRMIFIHNEFEEFDYGFDFYAPQVLKLENRHILIGWAGMPENEEEYLTINDGYIYTLTLPRELFMKNNHIYQLPIQEIYHLRNKNIYNEKENINDNIDLKYRKHEIVIDIDVKENNEIKFGFKDGYISILYDEKEKTILLDRSRLSIGKKGIRKLKLKDESYLKLDIFFDVNIIEIFINNGKYVMTALYFTKDTSMNIGLKNSNAINEINIWSLNSFHYEN